jgi:hypothetical protein
MKTQALQEMVHKIFSDEKTRARFMACPESVISRFALTGEEIKAVLSTYKTGLAGSSRSLESAIVAKGGWLSPTS